MDYDSRNEKKWLESEGHQVSAPFLKTEKAEKKGASVGFWESEIPF